MIVVCGIDGSPNAQHALQWSADLVAGDRWRGDRGPRRWPGRGARRAKPCRPHRTASEIEDLCVTVWCAQLARSGVAMATRGARRTSRRRHAPRGRGVRRRPDRRRTARPGQRGGDREHERRAGSPRHLPGRDRPVVRIVTRRSFSRDRSNASGASATPTATTRPRCGTVRRPGPDRGRRDHRVEVELSDLRHGGGERPHPQQQVLEGGHVDRRTAAVTREQRSGLRRADQLGGVDIGHRDDLERSVGEQLGRGAAETEHHDRAEQVVAHDADDRFDSGFSHRLEHRAAHPGHPLRHRRRRRSSPPRRRRGPARRRRRRSCAVRRWR